MLKKLDLKLGKLCDMIEKKPIIGIAICIVSCIIANMVTGGCLR